MPVLFFIVPAWFFIVIADLASPLGERFVPIPRAFCAAATAGIIVNSLLLTMAGRWNAALEALSADRAPYPPRAARNSCGVVPVCLRKNRAK